MGAFDKDSCFEDKCGLFFVGAGCRLRVLGGGHWLASPSDGGQGWVKVLG